MLKKDKRQHLFSNGLSFLAKLSARNPFEMMVVVFLLCSFSYFYITNTIGEIIEKPVYIQTNSYGQVNLFKQEDMKMNPHDVIVKQLVLSSGQDMMNKESLMSVLSFKKLIEADIQEFCYRKENGTCFVKSPLEYWNDDMDILKSDKNVRSTILRHPYHGYFLINNQNNHADRIVLSFAFKASEYDKLYRWEEFASKFGQYFISHKHQQWHVYLSRFYTNLSKLFQVLP